MTEQFDRFCKLDERKPPGLHWTLLAFLFLSCFGTFVAYVFDNTEEPTSSHFDWFEVTGVFIMGVVYLLIVYVPVTYIAWNLFIGPTLGLRRVTFREAISLSAGLMVIAAAV